MARRNPIAVKRMVKIRAVRSARTVAWLDICLISTRSAGVSGWELTSGPPNSTADAWALTSRLTAARYPGLMVALDLTPPERPPAIDAMSTDPTMAVPSDDPIWRRVLFTPEASPAWLTETADMVMLPSCDMLRPNPAA
jgi:hypothetical protein